MKRLLFIFLAYFFSILIGHNGAFAQFGSPQLIAQSEITHPSVIASADIDNDGDKDVVFVTYMIKAENIVGWYANDGSGNFNKLNLIDSHTDGFSYLDVADMDNDGDIDIIAANYHHEYGKLVYYENSGRGSFDQVQVISEVKGIRDIAIAEINGDQKKDILFGTGKQLGILYGLGKGKFSEENTIADENAIIYIESILPQDIDNDGDIDIACTVGLKRSLLWFVNDGMGGFEEKRIIEEFIVHAHHLNGSDFNQDGFVDLVLVNEVQKTLTWYENLQDGTFGEQQIIDADIENADIIACADVNQDELIDIVTFSGSYLVWYENKGSGEFEAKKLIDYFSPYSFFTIVEDLDNNGQMDIVVSSRSNSKIVWLRNKGNGIFDTQKYLSKGPVRPYGLLLLDSNQDGYMDFLTQTNNGNYAHLYRNTKMGGFVNQGFGIEDDSYIRLLDVNNDGQMDIVSSNFSNQVKKFDWYENTGSSFSEQKHLFDFTDVDNIYYLTDINKDGFFDIVTHLPVLYSPVRSVVSIYINKGNYSFDKIELEDQELSLLKSATIDIDNNGYADILCQDGKSLELFVYFNNGESLSEKQKIADGQEVKIYKILTMDLNEDGLQDLIYQTLADYRLVWLANNGDGTFGEPNHISIGEIDSTPIVMTDLDRDNDLDILAATKSFNYACDLIWYENIGQGNFKKSQIITSEILHISAIAAHDFDNDQDIDIVVTSGSHNQIWQLENQTYHPTPITTPVSFSSLPIEQTHSNFLSIGATIREHNIAVNKESFSEFFARISPNPFSDYTTIEVEGLPEGDYQLEVMDILGRKVRTLTLEGEKVRLERGGLDSGVYIFRIVEKEKLEVIGGGKVLVE